MKLQKHDIGSISTIVVLVVGLIYFFATGDPVLLGRSLETKEAVTTAPAWDEPQEGEIVTIQIANDGDIIQHGDKVRLEGAIEFTGKKGDRLVLQRHDDVWVEIGRHFVD